VVRLSREGRREEAHDLFDAYLPPVSYEQQQGVGVHADCWDASRAAQDRGDRSTRSDRDRRACEGNEMTGHGAREPPAPPIRTADEARTRVEETRIARWVAAQIVNYPLDRCLCSRRPIVFGVKWVELVNDNERARCHFDCLLLWRAQQEKLARRAMGYNQRR
jgi:hypothetical protein